MLSILFRVVLARRMVAPWIMVDELIYSELAKSFVATRARIEAFLQKHDPPFIAKVYRASPTERALNPSAPGHISLWVDE